MEVLIASDGSHNGQGNQSLKRRMIQMKQFKLAYMESGWNKGWTEIGGRDYMNHLMA